MKFKRTLLNSGLLRRLLSTSLAATMVLGLLPVSASATTASHPDPVYNRESPEVPILNAYTGTSSSMYDAIKGAASWTGLGHYNAFGAVTGYVGSFVNNWTLPWDADHMCVSYADSVLRELSKPLDNLEVNLSGTFHNRPHTHTHAKKLSRYKYEIVDYEKALLQIGSDTPVIIDGIHPKENKDRTTPRIGDYDGFTNANRSSSAKNSTDSYGTVYYNENDTTFNVQFVGMDIGYYHFGELQLCTCSGTILEDPVMTFRDDRAPKLTGIHYSLDGGTTWVLSTSGLRVKEGSTLLIKLSYDEPIRFADDSAAGKGDLYLELQEDGATSGSGRNAYLTRLDGRDLYFSYTFDTSGANWDIQSLDMASLFRSSLLKQLDKSRSFDLDSSLKGASGTTGFTTTTCYVTDLAGNALTTRSLPAGDLLLDSEKPYVKNVQFDLALNNADVKEALGKDTLVPGTKEYQTSYTDASDLYLGVGDTVSLVINMNERLTVSTLQGCTAVATTNIKDGDDYVTVESRYFIPESERISRDYTSWVMKPIKLEADWEVDMTDNPSGEIRVTALALTGGSAEITDLAGNPLNKADVTIVPEANANPPLLDVTAPEVAEAAGSYSPEPKTGGFRCGVDILDDASGYQGIYGSFVLKNGGDGKKYQYEWAVTGEAETTEKTVWTTGVTGAAQRFQQPPTTYIHIRPKADETYGDLSGCTLTVKGKDFAGNESSALQLSPPWYIDNLAPTAKAGETERSLKDGAGNGGTLTVKVVLTDSNGISLWKYGWSDSATDTPTSWTEGELLAATTTSDPVTVEASADVADKTLFSQYLWVTATDNSGKKNPADPICLGKYTYDLQGAQYELKYPSGITNWINMMVPSLGTDDSLFFLVRAAKADGAYALLRVDGSPYYNSGTNNIFSSTRWNYGYTFDVDANGHYTLTKTEDSAVQAALETTINEVKTGKYSGELTVEILSGPKGSVAGTVGEATLKLGDESYLFNRDNITLRTTGVRVDNYGTISITSDSPLGGDPDLHGTATPEHPHRSSLAGMVFTISIEEDLNGWNYADVDWANSYVRLRKNVQGEELVDYYFQLLPGQVADDGSTTQTVTIPEDDYVNGIYYAILHIECKAGQDYDLKFTKDGSIDNSALIVVDTAQPNSDFSLTSMTYAPSELWPDKYGIEDFYGTLNCLEEDGIITLPVADGTTFGTGYPGQSYQFTISSPTEKAADGLYGWYRLKMWNMADPTEQLTIAPTDSGQQTVKNNYYISDNENFTYSKAYGFVFDKKEVTDRRLYLEPDVVNTVAMQKVYSNGLTSQIKYVRIKPVTQHITGSMSVDNNTHELVFTPDVPAYALNAKIYAWAWQNTQTPLRGEGQRIPMTPASDGTWRCSLVEQGAKYEVITVNSAGSICDAGFITEQAPQLGTPTFTDNQDGTYELHFAVSDDYDTMQNGLSLDVSFNQEYSTDRLGFTIKKGSGLWTEDWTPDHLVYDWAETGASTTGLYSVTVVKYSTTRQEDYLGVTVKGCFKNVDCPTNITVTATDAMGHTAAVSTGDQTVNYRQPVIYDDDDANSSLRPKLGYNGLILTFNQPVRPMDSWAWQDGDSDVIGFHTQWEGAFPIAGNGTYELQFLDIFGNTCTQELTTNAFKVGNTDWSTELFFSNSNLTGDSVAVTATSVNGFLSFWEGDGSGTIWEKAGQYQTFRLIDQSGNEWPRTSIPNPANGRPLPENALKDFGTKLRGIRWETNGKMFIRCGGSGYSEGNRMYGLTVYIGNIVKSAPPADVRYYVYDLGREFSQAELTQYIAANGGSVTGNVQVWYKTTRSVTPTEGGKAYLFTPENYKLGHTFTYADDAGNTGSVTVNLEKLGLTLQAPATPPKDTTAPYVNIDVYAKRSGSYTQEEAFMAGDTDITQRFERLGYVQGYSLAVNVSDASGYDISLSGEGAALMGNMVTISKAGTFTITVTDRSANKNATAVTFTVPAMIDTTPPEGTVTATAISLYEKTLTIALTDKDDAGNETENGSEDTVALSLPANAVRARKNTYTYHVTENGEVGFEFYDLAGNRGTAGKTVTGVDTEPPVLSVRWSPSNPDSGQIPPYGPLNTNVTARIRSNKAMYSLTVQVGSGDVHTLLLRGVAQPCSISGPVNLSVTSELVTVTYSEEYGETLTFTATAPNGKSATLTLNGLYGVIDKTPPAITQTSSPLSRSGYSVPYAVQVTLTPIKEHVTSPNYGAMTEEDGVKQPVTYSSHEPLVLTFTENGTYNVRFLDAAGNVTIEPVVISDVDHTAPVLTVTTTEANNQVKVTAAVNEPCTLTWGESGRHTFDAAGSYEITFTQNGTYAITATDDAGNKSTKMVHVGSIDGVAPSISFTSGTIYVKESSSTADLLAALGTGYTVWDNITTHTPDVTHDGETAVKLNTAGQYTVTYTVTDGAGNKTTANRFVRVIGKDTVCLNVDGKLILPDSAAVLSPGAHRLTLENNSEPYSVKARQGILSAGQMKYLSGSSLSFDENGNFSVNATGYYTLLVTTQSRQTIRILLYVEQ